ncbi:MAG: iron ABC transporter permease [endosymbiont of Seepiophila jonesi]|uniref:Iron ABC transporter permease n=1 Tax=endosymbiont of Lamellibrachia luymesi TaxID=2200907 RepID=A0A370E0T2_9GAMM|nr:MAG: iron ABC transporter permease [endosymbiont of Seepiophila jonesi]RDH91937.1 MAG: iron ABC transporter permease [endosymbiont of Lamellibrachia luymesi]
MEVATHRTSDRTALYRPGFWQAGVLLSALVLALPVFTVFSFIFVPAGEVWSHLAETVLADYLSNSALLVLGVAFGVLLLGIPTAWVIAVYDFPGRRFFEWSLLLPLAMPAYIIAYTYTGLLDFAGPIQTGLRNSFGLEGGDYYFPEVRSLGGAVIMLSLVLYPYVFMMARSSFLGQSSSTLEAGRALGAGPLRVFLFIALPLARPAIVTGLSLALMETLADYGTVQYFGISTFTTGIFRTWFGLNDSAAAAQLAALLMSFVFILILLEHYSRRHQRFYQTGGHHRHPVCQPLKGWQRYAAITICVIPLLFGFLIPAGQLLVWALSIAEEAIDLSFLQLAGNSLLLASTAAIFTLMLALFLGYGQRLHPSKPVAIAVRFSAMGYAIPGTVIAVGVMLPFAWFDNTLDEWMRGTFDLSTGLLLSGTVFALLFSYAVRFLAVSLQSVESGLSKITPNMDDAARSLGLAPGKVLRRIHLPMMRGALLTAMLLVFVDVLKELPATLILRPFNFNTLAVRAYELASDERLADSSIAALSIVVVGIVPVILLSRAIRKSGETHE